MILHDVASPRNDSDFLIPAKKIEVSKSKNESDDYYCFFGGDPELLQKEQLQLDNYQFCMQIYGGDFPEEFENIFDLEDAIGYLFLSKETEADDEGLFFVQCT